jgi:Domain of unknown function (DUF4388)
VTLKGSTKEFPLETLLRLLHDTKKTGELTVRGPGGEGALGLADGRVVTAMFGTEKPIPALGAIFKIGDSDFEFLPWDDAPPANLEGELEENLKRAEEYAVWLASVREVIPHDGIRFRLSERAADQGAVTFTPDRWRVVMAVNTQPDVTTLAANLHIDRDDALTTLAGLVRDGVIETIDAPAPPPPPPAPPQPAAQEWRTAAPVEEPAAPAAKERAAPESSAAFAAEEGDWSAALLRDASAAQSVPAEAAPPAPVEQAPAWAAPAEPAPEPAPASQPSPAPEWTAPAESAPQWAAPEPTPPAQVAPATPEPQAPPSAWGPAVREAQPPQAARPADPKEWGPLPPPEPPTPSVLDAIPQAWGPPQPAAPEPVDDRLAALSGIFDTPAKPAADQWSRSSGTSNWTPPAQAQTPAPEPALGDWGTPSSAEPAPGDWGAPPTAQPARPAAEETEDPRLAAMKMPVAPEAPPAPKAATPNEWAPPPSMGETARAPKKKGLGGLFRAKEPASEPAARIGQPERAASSRAGKLAAFCNALLTEFNSGRYGKGHVDDRIAGLLMRVDEQADPIDRPLPVVDDRLDVQALERVSMPEQQAVPYLALLASTIYSDAEKAFGRDKAKRGYKAAQQGVFGSDTSALSGPDLAGKLPKV